MHTHVLPAGTTGRAPLAVDVSPESANWTYSGLKIAVLGAGESYALATGKSECMVLPLEGAATVSVGGETFQLQGRSTISSFRVCSRPNSSAAATRCPARWPARRSSPATARPTRWSSGFAARARCRGR